MQPNINIGNPNDEPIDRPGDTQSVKTTYTYGDGVTQQVHSVDQLDFETYEVQRRGVAYQAIETMSWAVGGMVIGLVGRGLAVVIDSGLAAAALIQVGIGGLVVCVFVCICILYAVHRRDPLALSSLLIAFISGIVGGFWL